jgi:hypothetical protein
LGGLIITPVIRPDHVRERVVVEVGNPDVMGTFPREDVLLPCRNSPFISPDADLVRVLGQSVRHPLSHVAMSRSAALSYGPDVRPSIS